MNNDTLGTIALVISLLSLTASIAHGFIVFRNRPFVGKITPDKPCPKYKKCECPTCLLEFGYQPCHKNDPDFSVKAIPLDYSS